MTSTRPDDATNAGQNDQASDRILTVPNVISTVRLLMVPLYLVLLFNGFRIAALIIFAVAAATDFLDGQVARRTHSVSKLGKLLDPTVDTVLMFAGILGIVLIGDIPAWFAIVIIAREAFLVIGGIILLSRFDIKVPVIYPGKVATTLLFVGFCGVMFGPPYVAGIPMTDFAWLPGFNHDMTSFWIYIIYPGLLLQLGVTVYYIIAAYRQVSSRLHGRHEASRTTDND